MFYIIILIILTLIGICITCMLVIDMILSICDQPNYAKLAIGDKEYSTKELMELLGLKHRPTFRDNYLLPALELGLIEMTVPDKPNSSKQKYKKLKDIEK